MTHPPPSSATLSNLLSTHRSLITTLTSFLTVSIHHILYLRRLYPPISFLSVRAYNYPVRQSRHPVLCAWINDAVSAVRDQLEKNTVEKVAVCIFECRENRVLERWTFDLRAFPSVEKGERDVPFDNGIESTTSDNDATALHKKINIADLEAQFRGILSRISTSAAKLQPLPSGSDAPECSFTVTIEVKDSADRPVGRLEKEERKWIAAEPDSFDDSSASRSDVSSDAQIASSGKTVPVRRLEAGELRMEVWIEESKAKFECIAAAAKSDSAQPLQSSDSPSQPSHSTAVFDPEHGYDLEPTDVHRKPHDGAFADYRR